MRSLSVGIIQHVPFEGPAAIGSWLASRGHHLVTWRTFAQPLGPPQPVLDAELLLIMGGPMSANDTDRYRWLTAEVELIRKRIEAGAAVIGICLGAQLIAKTLGGRVFDAPRKEIGWYPVELVRVPEHRGEQAETERDRWGDLFAHAPARLPVFHWHGETFSLPHAAVRRARSSVCENQAFTVADRVIGLQFHCESTHESVAALANAGAGEITPGLYQMRPHEIIDGYHRHSGAARSFLTTVLAHLENAVLRQQEVSVTPRTCGGVAVRVR